MVLGVRIWTCRPALQAAFWPASQTMSAAIGSAEEAVNAGVLSLPAGTTPDQVSSMIALSYGITYIWGTVGIILITKYLPKWWGIDAEASAGNTRQKFGVASGDSPTLSGWTTGGLRAYRMENKAWIGKTIGELLRSNPEYRWSMLCGWQPPPGLD